MIKELIDEFKEVSLIIRPRRWGKTLNMSMLQYFFSPEVGGYRTEGMFTGLKIAEVDQGKYLDYQGKNPVILVSFKAIKANSWERFLSDMTEVIVELYRKFQDTILESNTLSDEHKSYFQRLLKGQGNPSQLANSLKFLSECLFLHYNKRVIILIDEYDTPLNASYHTDDFENFVDFFKKMLGITLKGNEYLEKGVMTGILRLSKNRMLSDLNNLILYSFMDDEYSQHFGFREEEVDALFLESGIDVDRKEIQHWYNGYRSGQSDTVYNPWSILNCIDKKGSLRPYWIRTADEKILADSFQRVGGDIDDRIVSLLEGKSVESSIDEHVSFSEIQSGDEDILWSLLWATGYLTFSENPRLSLIGNYEGNLCIPNYEVSLSFRSVFPKWIRAFNREKYDSFLKNLISGNVEKFVEDLTDYMLTGTSYFDFPHESNYHTLLLGMTASLRDTHDILSNREIGIGRPDVLLIPKDERNPLGIILEVKKGESGKPVEDQGKRADKGLEQINVNKYDTTLKNSPFIKKILKLCLVFYGKEFVCRSQLEEIRA